MDEPWNDWLFYNENSIFVVHNSDIYHIMIEDREQLVMTNHFKWKLLDAYDGVIECWMVRDSLYLNPFKSVYLVNNGGQVIFGFDFKMLTHFIWDMFFCRWQLTRISHTNDS